MSLSCKILPLIYRGKLGGNKDRSSSKSESFQKQKSMSLSGFACVLTLEISN